MTLSRGILSRDPSPSPAEAFSKLRRMARLWPFSLALAFVALAATGFYLIDAHSPYRYRNVEPLLQKIFASQIKIDHYHRTYFPHPGFVAADLTLRRNSAPDLPPVGSARSLVVQGRWLDLLLFRKRVRLVDVEGLHIVIPPVGSRANQEDFPPGSSTDFGGPTTVVEQFNIHDATLDIMRTDGNRYSFPIRQLIIRNLRKGQAISYLLDMQNAKPTGRIQSTGSFGPLLPNNLGATPVSGNFTFSPVNLRDIHGISGTLSATGRFYGALASIEADGTSDTPNFAVGRGRRTHVTASAHGTINGLDANIVLHAIDTHIGASTIQAKGNIIGSPKVTNLDITVVNGRVQDLLRPFLHDEVPITGPVWLHSHAYLAPSENGSKFLQRLYMEGTFDIPAERLTNKTTERKLSAFSQRSQGLKSTDLDAVLADPDPTGHSDALSSLNGRAQIRDGIVSTERLACQMPGAALDLNGTFNFNDRTVHLLGNLYTESDISHVTTGFKSLLMKPLIPFFKRDNSGAVVPIAITGSPHRYKVTQNLFHHK
jgi:AsmA-like C-terminal region